MKKSLIFLFVITLFLSGKVFAQAAGEFRSVASGNWNEAATWEVYNSTTLKWTSTTIIPNSISAVVTVQPGHTITMGGAATVKSLNLNGIVITTTANLLTIYKTGSIVGGSNTAYIDGPIAVQVTGTGLKQVNLPVGKGTIGRPVLIEAGHNTAANVVTYTAEMFNAAPPAATLPASLASVSGVRYYVISKTLPSYNTNFLVRLSYDADDAVGNSFSSARVTMLKNSAGNWFDIGGIGTAPITGTVKSTVYITNAFPYFNNGIFAIASTLSQPVISGNAGVAGAVLSYFDGTAKTVTADATGNYTFKVPMDWSGTITPSAVGYTFNPANIALTTVIANKTAQNFSAISIYSDYRTLPDVFGDWNDPAMWEAFNPTTSQWESAINYPASVTGTVTNNNADLTINGALSISGTLINNGTLNLAGSVTITATGKLVNQGAFTNPAGGLKVYGTYEHAQDGGMIGVAGSFGESVTSFYTGSTLLITGVVSAAPTVPWWFSFPQMIWDCPNQTDDAFLYINSQNNNYGKDDYQGFGSLTVLNSNSRNIFMFSGQGRSVGNIVVDGPTSKVTAFTGTSTGIQYPFFSGFSSLTVQNGGQFYMSTNTGDVSHHVTINIWNNLTVSSNSVLATYGYPSSTGTSLALIGFYPNYPHTIDLSGQIPAPGLDAAANNLNFLIDGNILNLASPITANNLQFNGTGKIVSGGNLLTILPGGTVTGASATSFTDGPVACQVATTDPTTLIFPVGKGSVGRPLNLNLSQDAPTLTTYTAEMLNPPVPANALPLTMESVSTVRYYNISKGAGANVIDASVLINYSTDDGVGTKNSLLRIAKDDGAGNWIDLGGTGTAPTTGTITSTSNFTTFSDFVLGYTFCANPTDRGTIAATITSGCDPFDPAQISGSVIPGNVEYKWQSSVAPFTTWTDILSNTTFYDPAVITETTWYKRLVRATCKLDWIGAAETDVLTMTVTPLPANAITGLTIACAGDMAIAYGVTTDNSATATYAWSYSGPGATLSATTGSAITINFANDATSGTLTVIETNTLTGCSTQNARAITINQCFKTLNLTLYFEGLYLGGGLMTAALDGNTGLPKWGANIADHITVELHDAADYTTIHTVLDVPLSTTGTAALTIPATFNASYYITVKHRNSIETTTATAVSFAGNIINQSFTAPNEVFGGNLGLSIDGRYFIYGGDVNQDGAVDSGDFPQLLNDNSNYMSGYLNTDIDGNGSIDSGDFPVIVNNNSNYVGTSHP